MVTLGAATGLISTLASSAAAQDIEVTAQMAGRTLPPAYYELVRQRPDFFEISRGWIARANRAAEAGAAVGDTLPLVVIQALFADSPEPTFSSQDVQRVLFDGPSDDGTVSDFYSEASGGRFGIRGQALPWVRTSVTLAAAVGSSYGLGSDAETGVYLVQALGAVDSAIDFGQFDNDGPDGVPNSGDDDGNVDAVAFQFLEVSASCGGPGIWPHRSRISNRTDTPYVTDDLRPSGAPILVDDYIVQSTVRCDGVRIQSAGTIAHELGHVLGLPDLYDAADGILPERRRWVIGCWSLMAAGSWGCGTANRTEWRRPTHLGPWEKIRLGWLADEQVVDDVQGREFILEPIITSGRALRIPLSETEYFLVEYRKQMGFDLDLPSSGVLIYHIDDERPIRPCRECEKIYQVALVEADGNDGLVRTFLQGGNRGEPGDAFGALGPARFSNSTTPSTRLNSGGNSAVTLYDITVDDNVARVTLSTTAIAFNRLVERFLQNGADPLAPQEEEYLDSVGNRNGRYDVGDLRAYLKR
ncbi:MAG: M6 family metalloprotease domain-containing protein [Gemmatimonadales bacterium]|nr:M6 family metalloprotease domain-containing protein [Gemmatimonadales bacterium]NIN51407.1 M6 family metalloprotease domain-containing protein [Gemmatimonadales bacterium]NIP08871.1 M6 family metalloprotease domain-containing protein [Gemmatimonadales bacterium]NIQ99865.1 M6 family metalloprotease domain-containing protein [Gemmatimonadales bacterium]NIS64358.1 M6 family metalloprotease domain-containing protein [Gemmatimonadales bacterium]